MSLSMASSSMLSEKGSDQDADDIVLIADGIASHANSPLKHLLVDVQAELHSRNPPGIKEPPSPLNVMTYSRRTDKAAFALGQYGTRYHNHAWRWLREVKMNCVVCIRNISPEDVAILTANAKVDDAQLSRVLKESLAKLLGQQDGVKFVHSVMMSRLKKMLPEVCVLTDSDQPLLVILANEGLVQPFMEAVASKLCSMVQDKLIMADQTGMTIDHVRHLVRPFAYPIHYPGDIQYDDKILLNSPVTLPFYLFLVMRQGQLQSMEESVSAVFNVEALISSVYMARYEMTTRKGFDTFCMLLETDGDNSKVVGWYKVVSIRTPEGQRPELMSGFEVKIEDLRNESKLMSVRMAKIQTGEIGLQTVQRFYDAYFPNKFEVAGVVRIQHQKRAFVVNAKQLDIYNVCWIVGRIYQLLSADVQVPQVLSALEQQLQAYIKYKRKQSYYNRGKMVRSQSAHLNGSNHKGHNMTSVFDVINFPQMPSPKESAVSGTQVNDLHKGEQERDKTPTPPKKSYAQILNSYSSAQSAQVQRVLQSSKSASSLTKSASWADLIEEEMDFEDFKFSDDVLPTSVKMEDTSMPSWSEPSEHSSAETINKK